jgi:hypothetical protein
MRSGGRRAEHVAGLDKAGPHAGQNLELLAQRAALKQPYCVAGIVGGVQRLDGRIAAADPFLVPVQRVFILNVGGVGQHDVGQVARGRRRIDRPFESLANQPGQLAAVIDVGMGEDHRVDALRMARK